VPNKTGTVWGFDIGGANLKAVCLARPAGLVEARNHAFALWRAPTDLNVALRAVSASFPAPDQIVITMTGEIADCFPTKCAGVTAIVAQCETAFGELGIPIRYYSQSATQADPTWVTGHVATAEWRSVAASNWHAVARLWGEYFGTKFQAPGLIVDLGSTTLDLTTVDARESLGPATDWERIQQGRLVYTGGRRSPLAMILPQVEYRGLRLPLAQELFATIQDAYLLTGLLEEDEDDSTTSDGRPATRACAEQRIARHFCSDVRELPSDFIQQVAEQAQSRHLQRISEAINRVILENAELKWLLTLGEGERPLLQAIAQTSWGHSAQSLHSGRDLLDPQISGAMPAAAIAIMAQ
jgi:probable H4MPT-linked C1 transfer pathway protein